ncbi:MAG: bifunctional 23S rRNA (guanine(2069)-N(7))-methyltransferase RlmK/23S rRNA (guanine(2445)-N(2))-methyltransferase RlmL [Alcanivorax sp.]|nr:bifunctional 23S rRNA (guanine(2069)-N(7))-methyltransferase RlmK/23S rRNA (guanine(2445)-N(2))-methyltransferase RlmL [Alcanivorax sp.]
MDFVITCLPGVAPLLVRELTSLGLQASEQGGAAARLAGGVEAAMQVCLRSRLAERVLLPVARYEGDPLEAAPALADAFDWSRHTGGAPGLYLRVDHERGVRGDSRVTASRFLRAAPASAPVRRDSAERALCLRMQVGEAVSELFVDFSGESLQRRGYRLAGGQAPLRETLAAAMLVAAGWLQPEPRGEDDAAAPRSKLVDPFCGSGTLLIEAALMATGRAPGLLRSEFGLLYWPQIDRAVWQRLREAAHAEIREAPAGVSLKGFDADPAVLRQARANAERAGVLGLIHFERRELGSLRQRDLGVAGGDSSDLLVVTNPPWGERLEDQEQAGWLYHALGQTLARHAPQARALVVGHKVEILDRTGMTLTAQWRVRNGPLQVWLRAMAPQRRAPAPPLRVSGEAAFDVPEQAQALVNRLRKNSRQLRRWLDQSGVQAYRLYDRDLPEFNVCIDIYGDKVLVHEYAPPKSIDPAAAEQRRVWAVSAVRAALGVHREQVFLRTRSQQRGHRQYQKLDQAGEYLVVEEGAARLLVNLRDYLDSGLFLDHRPMRLRLAQEASGKRFLNLFGYTGAATVHAALGGASRTVTVDASKRYLDWAGSNMAANGFSSVQHERVRADVMKWVSETRDQFDLVFCDPPTFSNSKSRDDFVVQRDHGELIRQIMRRMEPGGVLYFSCNFRGFQLDDQIRRWYAVEDISRWSIPDDFRRNMKIHYCFAIRHGHGDEDAG